MDVHATKRTAADRIDLDLSISNQQSGPRVGFQPQRLHLLNSSHIQRKIERSQKLRFLFRSSRNPRETITRLYLTILSRFPTENELKVLQDYAQSGDVNGPEVLIDVAWALINSAEFLYRH